MLIHGHCHCGNLRFQLRWAPDPSEIPARACTCSFCRKHGGVWTACPSGELLVAVRDPALHSRYVFETRTADFHVCRRCGVVPVVTSRIDGTQYAVVNVNAFDGVDGSLLKQSPVTFDTEDEASRLARRRRNWIGRVAFMEIGN
ncbi:MAG: hypothetical protein AMXMBFR59_36380 [Rhodanobacteraceae bacterium]